MANSVGAQIATGIELQGASSALSGRSSSGEYEDAVSIMVAPGWDVLRRGGGQTQSGSGARGVAVMLHHPSQLQGVLSFESTWRDQCRRRLDV